MTNQEHPVREHVDLPDDALDTTTQQVVNEQAEQPTQSTQAGEEQAETTEQVAPPAEETSHEDTGSAAQATADIDASADEPPAPSEESSVPVADVSASVEAPTAGEASPEPVQAEATAGDVEEAAVAAGASYTPVADDSSGRPRRVKDLEAGMELEGRVTSIALYGIFVDIGVGRDGLVHISEMSDTRIDSPSDLVQIGDTVHVRVKSVEPDGRRISLTMRSKDRGEARGRRGRKPELNREALSALRVGDIVEGTVTGIAPFGAFVDIGVGKDGLVHISELSEGRIDRAEDAVQVGQRYNFKLLEVDAEGTRISLSLRRAQRAQRMQQLDRGQILEGTVSGLAPFGAFVDIGVGRDGLVHISELSDTRVNKVEDVVQVGDKVQVRVLEFDAQSKRISLSMRLEDTPREAPAPRVRSAERRDEPAPVAESYSSDVEDEEEDLTGNATLEDLLSKYGNGSRRERRRRRDEEDEGDEEDRVSRRQREALRRTLQHLSDDE